MRAFKITLFILLTMISLSGCGKKTPLDAQATVNEFLTEYKNKNFYVLADYVENEASPIAKYYVKGDRDCELIYDTITGNFTYKINSFNETGNTATVNVSVRNIDMGEIMSSSVGEYLAKGEEKSKDPNYDINNYLYDLITENIEKNKDNFNETTFDLPLKKEKKRWVIAESQETADFFDEVMGRYYSYCIGINTLFQQ